MANGQINVGINVTANTQQAKAQFLSLQQSLQAVITRANNPNFGISMTKGMQQASLAAKDLQAHLTRAFNQKTGQLELNKLNASLKQSGQSVQTLSRNLLQGGQTGQAAFKNLVTQIQGAQTPVATLSKSVKSLITTFGTALKYQISYGAINAVTNSIRNAVSYAKELNGTMTDIQIVSGMSADEMDRLSRNVQKAAKGLNTTSNELAKAQLIYFQQGDSMALAAKKAEITSKAAKVSFNSNEQQMSEYLTAIWNSYQVGSNELELFVDKIAAVGATTATSMEELATAMTKVAATANAVGVSYDQLASTIAVISSATRTSSETVGTALKTIYARMGDLKIGGEDEDGIGLGQVSSQLKQVGVDILDENKNLRDMGTVVEEIGGKWQTWTEAERVAVAQAIAGKRQYTQLFALFENWDEYERLIGVTAEAQGTLNEQWNVWAKSWEGASARVKNATTNIYQNLINDDAMIGFTNVIADLTEVFGELLDSMGGIPGILTLIILKLMQMKSASIVNFFTNFGAIMQTTFHKGSQSVQQLNAEILAVAQNPGLKTMSAEMRTYLQVLELTTQAELSYSKNASKMNEAQQRKYALQKNVVNGLQEELNKQKELAATEKQRGRSGIEQAMGRNMTLKETKAYDSAVQAQSIKNLGTQAFTGVLGEKNLKLGLSGKMPALDNKAPQAYRKAIGEAVKSETQMQKALSHTEKILGRNSQEYKDLKAAINNTSKDTEAMKQKSQALGNAMKGISAKVGAADATLKTSSQTFQQAGVSTNTFTNSVEVAGSATSEEANLIQQLIMALRELDGTAQQTSKSVMVLQGTMSILSSSMMLFTSAINFGEMLAKDEKSAKEIIPVILMLGIAVVSTIMSIKAAFDVATMGMTAVISAIVVGITALIGWLGFSSAQSEEAIEKNKEALEKAKEQAAASKEEYEKLNSLVSDYENNWGEKTFQEKLEIQQQINDLIDDEEKKIDFATLSYQEQLDAVKKLGDEKRKQAYEDARGERIKAEKVYKDKAGKKGGDWGQKKYIQFGWGDRNWFNYNAGSINRFYGGEQTTSDGDFSKEYIQDDEFEKIIAPYWSDSPGKLFQRLRNGEFVINVNENDPQDLINDMKAARELEQKLASDYSDSMTYKVVARFIADYGDMEADLRNPQIVIDNYEQEEYIKTNYDGKINSQEDYNNAIKDKNLTNYGKTYLQQQYQQYAGGVTSNGRTSALSGFTKESVKNLQIYAETVEKLEKNQGWLTTEEIDNFVYGLGNLGDKTDEYANKLVAANGNQAEMNRIMKEATAESLAASIASGKFANMTQKQIEAELRAMGVTNAASLAAKIYANEQNRAKIATLEMNKSVDPDKLEQLAKEFGLVGDETEKAATKMAAYAAQQTIVNNTNLSLENKCLQFYNLGAAINDPLQKAMLLVSVLGAVGDLQAYTYTERTDRRSGETYKTATGEALDAFDIFNMVSTGQGETKLKWANSTTGEVVYGTASELAGYLFQHAQNKSEEDYKKMLQGLQINGIKGDGGSGEDPYQKYLEKLIHHRDYQTKMTEELKGEKGKIIASIDAIPSDQDIIDFLVDKMIPSGKYTPEEIDEYWNQVFGIYDTMHQNGREQLGMIEEISDTYGGTLQAADKLKAAKDLEVLGQTRFQQYLTALALGKPFTLEKKEELINAIKEDQKRTLDAYDDFADELEENAEQYIEYSKVFGWDWNEEIGDFDNEITARVRLKNKKDANLEAKRDTALEQVAYNKSQGFYSDNAEENARIAKEAEEAIIDEYYKNKKASDLEFQQWQREQIREAAEYELEQWKETQERKKAELEAEKTITEGLHESLNSIREAQHEINKELQTSLTQYQYLDKETRKLLFNTDDYLELSEELTSIQKQASKLAREYNNKILGKTEEEIEHITAEYERQNEMLMKQYEIKKAELEVEKKRLALNNVLNERNTQMFIDGQWQWVADTKAIADAQQALLDAEYERDTATIEKQQQKAIDRLDSAINDLDLEIAKAERAFEDLCETLDGDKKYLDSILKGFGNNITSISSLLVDEISNITDKDYDYNISIPDEALNPNEKDMSGALGYLYSNATGTDNAFGGISRINEKGLELLATKYGGQFIELNPGDKVFNHDQFDFLYKFSKNPFSLLNGLSNSQSVDNSIRIGNFEITGNSEEGEALRSILTRILGNH